MNQLIQFLEQPGAYPHGPEEVKHVQTHISHVFIVPPYVYKIKKPVDFGFLDYSSLEKRKHFCEQEVALNRRLCKEIYLGVVPITRVEGRFYLEPNSGANGSSNTKIIEYAVKMKKLPGEYFLHAYLERNELERAHLDRICARLADFYNGQDPGEELLEWGSIDSIRYNMEENFRQAGQFTGRTIDKKAFESIRRFTFETLERREGLFNKRVENKRIIDGHGDLHLEHIHITEHTLCIYDCIEFNKRFRYIDVAADLAFLAMDLDFHGRPNEGRYVIDRMAELLDDGDLPDIIDFYKCYRAFVKGKVKSLQAAEEEVPRAEREAALEKASRYFKLCLRYALTGSSPLALIVMGRVGTGKSTVAESLSEALNVDLFSSDKIRKQVAGLPLDERTPDSKREQLYSKEQNKKTYGRLVQAAMETLEAGKSVLLDATFSRREERSRLINSLESNHFNYLFIETQVPEPVIRKRLEERDKQRGVVSDARLEDFETIDRHYQPPEELSSGRLIPLDTGRAAGEALGDLYRELTDRHISA